MELKGKIIDFLGDLAAEVEAIDDEQGFIADQLDELDEEVEIIGDEVFGDYDDEDYDEDALYDELERLVREPVGDYELRKVQNKFEANITFGELNVMNKAMNLGYYRMLGDMSLLNGEVEIYRSITAEEIADYIRHNLCRNQSATLIYRRKQ